MPHAPQLLGFDDRSSTGGAYPVVEEHGRLVASVAAAFWRSRFEATDAEGLPLCTGKARLISGWRAFDPEGAELALLRVGFPSRLRTYLRDRTIECRSIGRVFTREWYLQTLDGRNLVQAVPHDDSGPFGPDVWVVRGDGTLSLAEVVGVVELHRLEYKRKRRRHPSSRTRLTPFTFPGRGRIG